MKSDNVALGDYEKNQKKFWNFVDTMQLLYIYGLQGGQHSYPVISSVQSLQLQQTQQQVNTVTSSPSPFIKNNYVQLLAMCTKRK